ncbi:anaerobic ribonucleoside-triphosphate reductase activating protein [archaeon]|jgi:pyruvate formate lyase activating enzyme|nr:anaerobic ribonucleoside-triphosphate reductase activating protein [archaeon]MBT3577659.1 anaerobic ribonucleoside-triphosphate reductase activating protein [archaeon]MBT6820074.1 anaerobic ribonucleoside-triphosphate reductase activating protein [archaeon]MBT6956551.1 anaerobic ribonucleoside-triphosphate reductase activating protein [archaeon]MBT7025324.1 anaerobic ribonucleoside-triphosphate reductase activating protein [archaeon]
MKISGLQKMTLIDYPGEVACTVFLFGCNFRCGFCYNPGLVIRDDGGEFSVGEVLDFLKKRKGKLDAVCISGGEPLMSLDISFIRKIKDMGYKIKIDTNGSFPGRLKNLIDLGLVDYVAMDIKASKENYSGVAGVAVDIGKIEESIKIVSGLPNYEFRTTIIGPVHDSVEIKRMGEWIGEVCGGKPKKLFLQGFKVGDGDMIEESFTRERDISEYYLKGLKKVADNYFEDVRLRV